MNFANLHQNFILLSPLTLNQHLDNHGFWPSFIAEATPFARNIKGTPRINAGQFDGGKPNTDLLPNVIRISHCSSFRQSASSFSMPLLPETSRCLHKPPRHRECAAYPHKISVSPKPAERQSAISTSSFQTAFPFRPSEKTKAGHRYPAFIVPPALFLRRPISSRPCCSAESRY